MGTGAGGGSRREGCAKGAPLLLLAALQLVPILPPRAEDPSSSDTPPESRETPVSSIPDDATLESSGVVIGEIVIVVGDVFDPSIPEENNRLFRAANKLHIATRESVVRSQLLFESGEVYSRRILDESERNLRAAPYFYDASIRAIRVRDGVVDVEVRTRDVWTLTVSAGFGRKGGENSTRFGIEERNLLGFGKQMTVRRTSNVDRTSILYRYTDPNILGSRARMELGVSDNSDGRSQLYTVERPFYALDTRWSLRASGLSDDRIVNLYSLGEVTDTFRQERKLFTGSHGRSRGLVNGRARRWFVGYTYDDNVFGLAPGEPPPAMLPENRTLSYPWVGFESVEDEFIELHDYDKLARTEDLNLGTEVRFQIGATTSAFGGDRDQAIFGASVQKGIIPSHRQILSLTGYTSGRWGSDGGENILVGGRLRYYVRNLGQHLFFAGLRADAANDLDGENQLLLGGDNGLRGYPLRYQEGDRLVLLTLEQRFYTGWHAFRLFHVGAAVFADVGRAWFEGSDDPAGLGWLKDVGVGLRIGNSRSAEGSLVHVDVAFPLDGDPTIERTQLLITTRETF
jgi:hypothetical protein